MSRRSMINPLNKGRIQEFNNGPCIILKGEKYDSCDDIHKYTVKYLITGQVYTGIHYRRILKVNPNAIPTFPSLEGHLDGQPLEGTKIVDHRFNPKVGVEYLMVDDEDDTYHEWLNSHVVPPSMITVYWEQNYRRKSRNRDRQNSNSGETSSASVESRTSGSGVVRCVVPEDHIPYDINLESLDISDLFISDFSEEEHLVEEGV
eukprot:Nk52_evm16s216 gene=Nk52_evmTU16s216